MTSVMDEPLRPDPTRVVREYEEPVDPPLSPMRWSSRWLRENLLEAPGDRGHYTWEDVPVGHYVPGSGVIIEKHFGLNGVMYMTFERLLPRNASTWVSGHTPTDRVPILLTTLGLVYWR